jgi:hypothetical protein
MIAGERFAELTNVAQVALISIYRITFHPLVKYPGPFLAKISGWPLVFDCYNGNRHLVEYKNHQKYGRDA